MANNFRNTDLVTKIAVKEFLNASVMLRMVDRQLDKEFRTVGETVSIRRPVMFTAESGQAISVLNDIEDKTVPLTLDRFEKVAFEIDSKDLVLEVAEMTERYIRPSMVELAQIVESSIGEEYINIGNFEGTPGTSPGTFLSIAEAKAVLNRMGVPLDGDRSLFVDSKASVTLANGLQNVFPTDIASRAIKEAMVGRYGGWNIMESNSLPVHTVGALGGVPVINGASQTVTYATAGSSWTQTLLVDTWTSDVTDVVLAGDVFTIPGVESVNRRTRKTTGELQTFSITADADSGASTGPSTLTITPPMIISGPYQTVTQAPVDGDPITILTGTAGSTHRQNLGWHKNAITLAMAPLDTSEDGVSASTQNFQNVSIRALRQFDINSGKTIFRFDILWGVKVQNNEFAVRITS